MGLGIIGVFAAQDARQQRAAVEAAAYNARSTMPSDQPSPTAVSFTVVGDSITAANSRSIREGEAGSASWVSYASAGTRFVGGWAEAGSTTDRMVASAEPVDADVLVILAGTNDVAQGVPFERTAQNLRDLADRSETEKVVVSAIPPFDRNPSAAEDFNEELATLASEEGWLFVDPMAELRDGGLYRTGFTEDGVHPTVAGAQLIGAELLPAITG